MFTINSLLYGLVAGLVGLKFVLLGFAAVLLVYTLTERNRQRKIASVRTPARPPRLDVHA